jgi:hypothetical protein
MHGPVSECQDYYYGFCPRGPKCPLLHVPRAAEEALKIEQIPKQYIQMITSLLSKDSVTNISQLQEYFTPKEPEQESIKQNQDLNSVFSTEALSEHSEQPKYRQSYMRKYKQDYRGNFDYRMGDREDRQRSYYFPPPDPEKMAIWNVEINKYPIYRRNARFFIMKSSVESSLLISQ